MSKNLMPNIQTDSIALSCTNKDKHYPAMLCLVSLLGAQPDWHAAFGEWLHPKEFEYLDSLKHARRQESYLLGRLAAKHAIHSLFPEIASNSIFVDSGVFDQPTLAIEGFPGIQVSISHTEGVGAALIYYENHPMSVDIDRIRPDQHEVVFNFLTDNEKQELFPKWNSIEDGDFYTWIWTVKEALGKVLKTGIAASKLIFEVDTVKREGNVLQSTYAHFPLYKALSFEWRGKTVTVVLPKQSEIQWELPL